MQLSRICVLSVFVFNEIMMMMMVRMMRMMRMLKTVMMMMLMVSSPFGGRGPRQLQSWLGPFPRGPHSQMSFYMLISHSPLGGCCG